MAALLRSVGNRELIECCTRPSYETISTSATKELLLEESLQTMIGEWDGVVFATVPHKESGVHILTHLDDIQAQLEEHIVKVQAMRGSAFVKLIEEEVKNFYFLLLRIQSTIEEWTKVLLKSSSYFSLTCTLNFSNRDVDIAINEPRDARP